MDAFLLANLFGMQQVILIFMCFKKFIVSFDSKTGKTYNIIMNQATSIHKQCAYSIYSVLELSKRRLKS